MNTIVHEDKRGNSNPKIENNKKNTVIKQQVIKEDDSKPIFRDSVSFLCKFCYFVSLKRHLFYMH